MSIKTLSQTAFLAIIICTVICVEYVFSADEKDEGFAAPFIPACICSYLYDPVCASDGKTYGKSCELKCAKYAKPYLLGLCKGSCPCCQEPYINENVPAWPGHGWGPLWYGPTTGPVNPGGPIIYNKEEQTEHQEEHQEKA